MPGLEPPLHAAASAGDGIVPNIAMPKSNNSSVLILEFVARRNIQSPRFI